MALDVGCSGGLGDRSEAISRPELKGRKWRAGGIFGEKNPDGRSSRQAEGESIGFFHIDPSSLGGKPREDLQCRVPVGGVMLDFDPVYIRECALGGRIIEDAGDSEPELPGSCPSMVLQDQIRVVA